MLSPIGRFFLFSVGPEEPEVPEVPEDEGTRGLLAGVATRAKQF